MSIPLLNGLAEVTSQYELFIFDVWGVLYDGTTLHPEAIHCLEQLRKLPCKVALLSNAVRQGHSVAARMEKLGLRQDLYDQIVTSGDVTIHAFQNNAVEYRNAEGPEYFHIGPDRTRPTLEACGGREVSLEEAELIICTGYFDEDKRNPEEYAPYLKTALTRDLPMICANPDLRAHKDGDIVPCAGAIAEYYEKMGGKVQRFGKPSPYIFKHLLADHSDIHPTRVVMIGDTLATDIRGARLTGFDSIWIGGGIHAEELGLQSNILCPIKATSVARKAGEKPDAVMAKLAWQ